MTQPLPWPELARQAATLDGPALRLQARALLESGQEVPARALPWLRAASADWAGAVQAARDGGDLDAAAQLASLAGWDGVALDCWRAWAAADPADPRPRRAQLDLWARRRAALGAGATAADAGWLVAASDTVAVAVARAVAAEPAADPAWGPLLRGQTHRPPAVRAANLIALGDLAAAEATLDADPAGAAVDASARAARAMLHRWRGEEAAARTLARMALALDPHNAAALTTLGALAWRAGAFAEAVQHLERAANNDPAADEALAWLARAHLAQGDADRAQAALDRCVIAARGFSLPAALLRLQASAAGATVGRMEGVLPALQALWPERLHGLQAEVLWQAAEALIAPTLERLASNLSDQSTLDTGSALRRWTPPSSPRHACRAVLEAAHVAATDDITLTLAALCAAHPTSPIPLAYAGEWQLWLGDLSNAERLLRAAIERWPWVRWPHAGLATLSLLRGDYLEALRWLDLGRQRLGSEGPPWLVLRGEIAWRQGRVDAAVDYLQRAVAAQPARVAAQVLLGLARHDRGDRGAGVAAASWLADAAPGLFGDAVRSAASPADDRAVLLACLDLSRGCRASSLAAYAAPWHAPRALVAVRAQPGRGAHAHVVLARRLASFSHSGQPDGRPRV